MNWKLWQAINQNFSTLHSKKFIIEANHTAEMNVKDIQLSDLPDLEADQIVNVTCKVVMISPPQEIETKLGKEFVLQNVTVGDAKGCTKLTLWEDQDSVLKEG